MPNQYVTDDEYGGILDVLTANKKIEFLGWMWPNKQVRPDFGSWSLLSAKHFRTCFEHLFHRPYVVSKAC